MQPILSSAEIRKVLAALHQKRSTILLSLDLGRTTTEVSLTQKGMQINNKEITLPLVREDDKSCYLLLNDHLEKVQCADPRQGGVYKLVPTSYRPILQISGTSMHKQSFIERIEKDKLKGKVLDAGTGLGYTAIAAAKTADEVITIEQDEMVQEIAKLNPYSEELFSKNITRLLGDVVEEIKKYPASTFDHIIFDAGTPRSSGEFFSLNNYKEGYRVLKKGGMLYHYVPRPQVKRGRNFSAEIRKRLQQAGFKQVILYKEESYLIAKKT